MFTNKKYCYRINTDEHYGSYNLLSLEVGGEVVGTRKNGRARRRHVRGDVAPPRKVPENVPHPPSNYVAAVCDLSKVLTEND